MANKRLPRKDDKVKLINCKEAEKYEGKVFTVQASPHIMNKKIVVKLKELRGYYQPKYLKIIKS